MSWAEEEFRGIYLGDKRRDRRAVKLLERVAERPTASIPGACNGWAETQAAYRFLAQERFEWMDVLEPIRQCTRARMAEHAVVLCLQDTTELDFNAQAIGGLGPLSYEAQRGMYLHPSYAVSASREPLGVLDAWMWARDGTRPGITESVRWSESYARVAELAVEVPQTRLVYVADREADIRELMVRARDLGTPADRLLRSQHHRALPGGGRLWARVLGSAPLGEIRFTLPSGRARTARAVHQALYAQRVSLSDGQRGRLEFTSMVAREIGAPPGVNPIEWRLLTNRTADRLEAVAELIDWYRARLEIELLFLVLKEACRVDALQLSTRARIECALALFMVVAWRVARLMRLGRTVPDLDAGLLLEPEEWQAAYILAKKPLPKQPPRLNAVIRLIARVGGFLGRKADGEPRVKTVWLGLQRVMDFAAGIKFAKEVHGLGDVCNGMPKGGVSVPEVKPVKTLIFALLVADILANCCLISAHGGNEVPPRPQVLPDKIPLALPVHPRQVDRDLPLDVSDDLRDGILRRNQDQPMLVIHHQMPFFNPALFLLSQLAQHLPEVGS